MTDQIILNADPRERTGTNKAREIRNVDGMFFIKWVLRSISSST